MLVQNNTGVVYAVVSKETGSAARVFDTIEEAAKFLEGDDIISEDRYEIKQLLVEGE